MIERTPFDAVATPFGDLQDASADAVMVIAERLGGRVPSYELLSVRRITLPFWKVHVRLRVAETRSLDPLKEFVLRCVQSGFGAEAHVSRILGISSELARAALIDAFEDDLVCRASGTDTAIMELTALGASALERCAAIEVVEQSVPMYYDGLSRKLVPSGSELKAALLSNHARRGLDLEHIDIPAFPARPPQPGEIRLAEMQEALTLRASGEIISVDGLAEQKVRLYAVGFALAYLNKDTNDFRVEFSFDGKRLSDEHGVAFARAEGRKKLGIEDQLRRTNLERSVESVLPIEVSEQVAAREEIRPLAELVNRLTIEQRLLESEPMLVDAGLDSDWRDQLLDVREKLARADEALDQVLVQPLSVYEHPRWLERALRDARSRLVVVSPWVRRGVVNDSFVKRLEELLTNGVQVHIAYGLGEPGEDGSDPSAVERLEGLAASYANFQFLRMGNTHAKVLAVDDAYVIVSSFNWLSFRGDPNRTFRDERGLMVRDKAMIDLVVREYLSSTTGMAS